MNTNPTERYQLNEIDPEWTPPPVYPEPAKVSEIDPDNPHWGLFAGVGTWALSIICIFIFQVLFVIPVMIPLQAGGKSLDQEALMSNPTFVLVSIISAIPAHIATIWIVWMIVTNMNKKPFVKWLGLEWKGWQETVIIIGVAIGLLVVSGLVAYQIGGGVTDIDRMVKSSQSARFALAFIAAFSAPLAEELVYRGVLYPAARKLPGGTLLFIGIILVITLPFLWGNKPLWIKVFITAIICAGVSILIRKTSLKENRSVIAVIEVSLLFALIHVPQYKDSLGVITAIMIMSVGITVVRAVTGRLLPCIILHFVFNGIQAIGIVAQPSIEKQIETPAPQQALIILETAIRHLLI